MKEHEEQKKQKWEESKRTYEQLLERDRKEIEEDKKAEERARERRRKEQIGYDQQVSIILGVMCYFPCTGE